MTAIDTSPYLSGNYGPVTDDVTAFYLPVIGELPADLNGRYLRNGPNPMDPVDPKTHHWFMGDGMVHGIRLRDGKAEWYRNSYVGSAANSARLGIPDIAGPNWSGYPTLYRFHVEDPVTFRRSIRVTIEHGHANKRSDDLSSVAFWYQQEPHRPFSLPPVSSLRSAGLPSRQ